ncbi:MAG: RNB domain-containing ribonuclease [Desulfobacteraceae bacterium]|nr:RNB domain-containing ribonuclease [Desulfobacteraceae bacterium]
MKIGSIVEYIEQQRIISAVILEVKNNRLRLLNENNREIAFSENRLSHMSEDALDPSLTKDSLLKKLQKITQNRKELSEKIDIAGLWEILCEEEDEIDIPTMASFCFDPPFDPIMVSDYEAAVIRAFFNDRMYFKFRKTGLTPCSPKQLEVKKKQIKEENRKNILIEKGAVFIKSVLSDQNDKIENADKEILNILKWYYLIEKESSTAPIAKAMIAKADLKIPDQIFNILLRAGVWEKDENIDLLRMDIETGFSESVLKEVKALSPCIDELEKDSNRRDFTDQEVITIDGQSTLDFDDAISFEKAEDGYNLYVHIVDLGFYIKTGDKIDLAAMGKGSSIYMPDDKISMIPPQLSEDLCSLKEGEVRPTITTHVRLSRFFEIIDYEIVPGIIKVQNQMSYSEANLLNGKEEPITTLFKMATTLREKRFKSGAVQITLPEINIWIEETGEIKLVKVDRENPSRMLVSEFMILANSLMAEFLADNNVPAAFRSQVEPRERLFKGIETSLYINSMQRRKLSRAVVSTDPAPHSGLGVKAYVTATSPIRKYYDLLTHRQIRGILGYEDPYSKDEVEQILQNLILPVTNANKLQSIRRRYWILKYLETVQGSEFQALVLESHRDFCIVLLKDFMLESRLPSGGYNMRPGDLVTVTIQHVNARRDQVSLFA